MKSHPHRPDLSRQPDGFTATDLRFMADYFEAEEQKLNGIVSDETFKRLGHFRAVCLMCAKQYAEFAKDQQYHTLDLKPCATGSGSLVPVPPTSHEPESAPEPEHEHEHEEGYWHK